MTSKAQEIAQAIGQSFTKFGVGEIELWGVAAVRPNDYEYELVSAKADGARLDLRFAEAMAGYNDEGEKGSTLSVWDPDGFKKTERGLEIAQASRVKWTVWDLANKAGKLEVKGPGETSSRSAGKKPALALRAP